MTGYSGDGGAAVLDSSERCGLGLAKKQFLMSVPGEEMGFIVDEDIV